MAEILTDFPEGLIELREVYLWDERNPPRSARVTRCWLQKKHAVFQFEECDSVEEAEGLRGLQIQTPLADRVPLTPGKYYVSDLVGNEVWQGAERIGVVRDVQFAGTPLLVVDAREGELLIPLAAEICTAIDTAARRIEVVLPEGLRGLNQKR